MILILIVASCSSTPKKSGSKKQSIDDAEVQTPVPEWVYSPKSSCKNSLELCASGEGITLHQADLAAKNSLAGIFHTKINSSMTSNQSSLQDENDDIEETELTEQAVLEVNQSIDVILEAVSVKNRFKHDDIFYSHVALDIGKASTKIRTEIAEIDEEMRMLVIQGRRITYKKLLLLYEKRKFINMRLNLISESSVAKLVTLSQIQAIRFQRKTGNKKVKVSFGLNFPVQLKKHLESLLTVSGYKIIKTDNIDFLVRAKYQAKEEFLKVQGFKKYSFIVSIDGKNNLQQKIGSFTLTKVSTGRNKVDAFLKVKDQLQKELDENFDKLNL